MLELQTGRSPVASPKRQINFRNVEVERYDEIGRHSVKKRTPVVALRRKSHLVGFLIVLCQFAIVDTINFLPAGIILYAIGLGALLELLLTPVENLVLPWEMDIWEEEAHRQQRQKEYQEHYERAMFEYHVLKRQTNVKIVPIEENGKTTLYAI